ncbi:hypothetical protein QTQ03_29480 [Micromonospora sp. WMMA1363]|uniref:hypothetical protein n=1 Tax=Micromonospora sp. WMMA1363 TaxID=3053985 RepID=UPI00259D2639|nr:hypothetical protein [Micromonospora sp. WMMA1363]MDM4723511.1 hypothetical protein [Micromonospora sp. WMMA1363]
MTVWADRIRRSLYAAVRDITGTLNHLDQHPWTPLTGPGDRRPVAYVLNPPLKP